MVLKYHRIEALTEAQIVELHALYQQEWWTNERSLEDVRVMVENSSLIFGYSDDAGRLVAFCRVLTDFVFRAVVYDVIVADRLRGQGLGRRLMDDVSAHPRLQRVSTVWLCCLPEMFGFYQKWGYKVFDEETKWMIKAQREG